MPSSLILLFVVSGIEFVLLIVVLVFFLRLKRSEEMLLSMQQKQQDFLKKMHFHTELEQELVQSFAARQKELIELDKALEERAGKLGKLLLEAENMSRSPQFLREVILAGKKKGKTVKELAATTGLTTEEVEVILSQPGQ